LIDQRLVGASLLVFANKQDIQGALKPAEIAKVSKLVMYMCSRIYVMIVNMVFLGLGLQTPDDDINPIIVLLQYNTTLYSYHIIIALYLKFVVFIFGEVLNM
jgi:signal recognition particle receptor subunit beta